MKIPRIANAIGHIDEDIIIEAEKNAKPSKKKVWVSLGAIAACIVVFIVAGITILPLVLNKDNHGRYKNYSIEVLNTSIIWPWEYRSISEKYNCINDLDGITYYGNGSIISEALIENRLGKYSVSGYDEISEETYAIEAEVCGIKGIAPTQFVAVKLEEAYYVFKSNEYLPPKTLGELFAEVDLPNLVKLETYSKNGDSPDNKWYKLSDDQQVWDILRSCGEAPFVENQEWFVFDRNYISFSISSESLGIYKLAMYVTDDGFLWTNAFSWQYIFDIGPEAAGKILKYASENSSETEFEPYMNSVAGTLTEITDTYIVVDDSILCKDPDDGISYKVLINDIRISRYFDKGIIKTGDIVQVSYKGNLDETDNIIDKAVNISKAHLSDGGYYINE